jgi:hypothetical protein
LENVELEELTNKESEKTIERCKSIIGKNDLKFQDVFDLIYGDIKLHKYRHYTSSDKISPKYLLPFFEQVIISNPPLNEKSFQKLYGFEIEDLITLIKKNRIVMNLTGSYSHYSNLDFFDPVLELNPPSNVREFLLLQILIGNQFQNILDEIEKKYWEKINPITNWGEGIMKDIFRRTYLEMCSIGQKDIIDDFIEEKNMIGVFTGSVLLSGSIFNGLNGIPNFERKQMGYYMETSNINMPGDYIFPFEIGKVLTEEYQLYFPLNVDSKDLEKIYMEKVMGSARNLLYDLYLEIYNENQDIDLNVEEFKNTFHEVKELMLSIEPLKQKYNKWIGVGIAVGTYGLTYIPTSSPVEVAGLLASLGWIIKGEAISEKIARWKLGQLPSSIWTFEEEFSNIQDITLIN